MKDQSMTAKVNLQNVERENPPVRSMADRLRDFTRMNPHIFTGSKTSEDPRSFRMRCIRFWWLWGPPILRKQSLLLIS